VGPLVEVGSKPASGHGCRAGAAESGCSLAAATDPLADARGDEAGRPRSELGRGSVGGRTDPGRALHRDSGTIALPERGGLAPFRGIDNFVSGVSEQEAVFDRVLATVLFTDIVDSTQRAVELGDRSWRDLLQRHHATVRSVLARYRGTKIDTAGDGFFATFDGPARAVRAAHHIIAALRPLGLEMRAGVHTGEVQTIDGKVGGLGVVIGARIGALAGSSEVFVTQTVKDLVAGSGLTFEDRGAQELRGVPDKWRVFVATG
jgi:class 3 adenylate cyclase